MSPRESTERPLLRVRMLVTGAGGPAAVGFLRLAARPDVEMYAADIDACAAGLYLVPEQRRVLLPRGDDPAYVDALLDVCIREDIAVVVPTVDSELLTLAGAADRFRGEGIRLLMAPPATLEVCLDKASLADACRGSVRVPHTEVLTDSSRVWFPAVVKPRRGSGSRGVRVVSGPADLAGVPRDGSYLIQELLPGDEVSVDVFARADGTVVAAVPRTRDRVDSGVAVAGRTVADPELATMARVVARAIGLRGIANVQLRGDDHGRPALLEVNPRLPGTMMLTAAAGANLPALALGEVMGEPVPDAVSFREVAIVRYLDEVVVPLEEYRALDSEAAAAGTSAGDVQLEVAVG